MRRAQLAKLALDCAGDSYGKAADAASPTGTETPGDEVERAGDGNVDNDSSRPPTGGGDRVSRSESICSGW